MDKTVSIVIPAYNEASHLTRCLDTIAAQTSRPDEVIVVDNNSTDNTAAAAAHFPFVRLAQESRQGIVFARNRGFDAATGSIIARIDADTMLPKMWVSYIRKFYANPAHAQIVWTGSLVPTNMPLPRVGRWVFERLVYPSERLLLGHYPLFGSNMAIPADVWRTVRGSICARDDIHEDVDLAIHIHTAGYPIVFDRRIAVGVTIKRMRGEFGALWKNAKMWPRTLYVHHIRGWPVALFESWLLMLSSALVMGTDVVRKIVHKQPLPE